VSFFNATRDWLERHRQPLQIIQGDWAQRRLQAFQAVAALLQT
jgi:nicotinamide riboside kinase